jgi:mannan endo-1,4-beta-mannosidase
MIFRLGYDPETIDIGGVTVESFGKRVAVGGLPATQASDRKRERDAAAAAKAAAAAPTTPVEGGPLAIAVDAGNVIRPISPYVYGINSQKDDGTGTTVRRMGGNRQTAYNWENNASNAGSDYRHQSDDWPCSSLGYRDCNQPGGQFLDFAAANKKIGAESLAVIPLVDWVTADKNGPVSEREKAPSPRWLHSFPHKPSPFTLTPDLTDGNVYEDEFVNLLVQKLGKASDGGIKFYQLDNEPALWPSTHPRIHPDKTRYQEIVTRSEATAAAITEIDPSAIVLGAAAYGWAEYMSLQEAPDAKEQNAQYGTYLDYFLASMKQAEAEHHRRLVHVLDVHWYPEARGSKRITDKDLTPKTIAARVQAPRSLWDPDYVEKSWIAAEWGKPIRLIPWLLERIAERYPGTKLSMTEYNYGVGDHISGGLAQADVLGIFGREGMYLATYWGDGAGNGTLPKYIKAAFKLYRNYDGKGAAFGDTAVAATPADQAKASVFAATDTKHKGVLTIIVINKDQRATFDGKLEIKGGSFTKASVFTFDGSSADIRAMPAATITGGQLAYRLPPLSATLFVCER